MTSGRFQLNEENDGDNEHTSNTRTNSSVIAATGEHVRKFVFSSTSDDGAFEDLEIKIPELLVPGYSFYTWPSAPVLAYFLFERRHSLVGKRILELGSGTALPGILSAKCGAHVILSDHCILPKSLAHIRRSCLVNNLVPGQDIEIIGLSWGLLLNSVFKLENLDLIIASDCFYDPSVFEDILVTVSFLLERNPLAKFLFTYQDRSTNWSIEALLKKWKLCALPVNVDIEEVGRSSGVDLLEFMGGHEIHLIEITRDI